MDAVDINMADVVEPGPASFIVESVDLDMDPDTIGTSVTRDAAAEAECGADILNSSIEDEDVIDARNDIFKTDDPFDVNDFSSIGQESYFSSFTQVIYEQHHSLPVDSSLDPRLTCHMRLQSADSRDVHAFEAHGGDQKSVLGALLHNDLNASKENRANGHVNHCSPFDCALCERRFSSVSQTISHLLTAHQALRKLTCGLCAALFYSDTLLKAHVMLHTNEKILTGKGRRGISCEKCGEDGFESNEQLFSHVKNLHAFQCAQCGESFSDPEELGLHFRSVHADKLALDRSFKRKNAPRRDAESLAEGELSHWNIDAVPSQVSIPLPGKCAFCSAVDIFTSQEQFDLHVQQDHPYRCPVCPKMVKWSSSIRKHFKKFHSTDKAFFCKSCTLVFTSVTEAKNHAQKISTKCLRNKILEGNSSSLIPSDHKKKRAKPESTQSSVLRLEEISLLNAFQLYEIESPDPEDIVEVIAEIPSLSSAVCIQDASAACCRLCAETFGSEADLLSHVSDSHPLPCPGCEKRYRSLEGLRKHYRSAHDDSAWLCACRLCALAFTSTSERALHMRHEHDQQSRGPAFDCPKCDRAYEAADSLRKHCRTAHQIASIFTCRECCLAFTDLDQRRIHFQSSDHQNNPRNAAWDHSGAETSLLGEVPPLSVQELVMECGQSGVQTDHGLSAGGGEAESTSESAVCNVEAELSEAAGDRLPSKKDEEVAFKCAYCKKPPVRSYKQVKGLRKHLRDCHPGRELLVCASAACRQTFRSKSQQKRHKCPERPTSRPTSPAFHGFLEPTQEIKRAKALKAYIKSLENQKSAKK